MGADIDAPSPPILDAPNSKVSSGGVVTGSSGTSASAPSTSSKTSPTPAASSKDVNKPKPRPATVRSRQAAANLDAYANPINPWWYPYGPKRNLAAPNLVTADTKILIPSDRGCDRCDLNLCMSHFQSCRTASVISVHCMDRAGFAAPFTIAAAMFVTFLLTAIGLLRDHKRMRQAIARFRRWAE